MKIEELFEETIPDGEYDGIQSGNELIIDVNGTSRKLKTKNGVRGRNIICDVTLKDGQIIRHSLGDFLVK